MDIGPVRRRLTVEPVVSPVSGEPAPRHEQAASERIVAERPERPEREVAEHAAPAHEVAEHAAPAHEAAPASRA